MIRRPARSALFPYTTLCRADPADAAAARARELLAARYEQYRAAPPEGTVILIEVERWSGWSDRKSTRLNSSHANISYAVFCLTKQKDGELANPVGEHEGTVF